MERKIRTVRFVIYDRRTSNFNKLSLLIVRQLRCLKKYGEIICVPSKSNLPTDIEYKLYTGRLYLATDVTISRDGVVIISSINDNIADYISIGISVMIPYWETKERTKRAIFNMFTATMSLSMIFLVIISLLSLIFMSDDKLFVYTSVASVIANAVILYKLLKVKLKNVWK